MQVCEPRVKVKEVSAVLTPDSGVSIYKALQDAKLEGFIRIEVDKDSNTAVVTWVEGDE